jgi:hypothetical protein
MTFAAIGKSTDEDFRQIISHTLPSVLPELTGTAPKTFGVCMFSVTQASFPSTKEAFVAGKLLQRLFFIGTAGAMVGV